MTEPATADLTTSDVTQLSNPAASKAERQRPPRVSMSAPRRRLQVPDLPGWHLHFFKEENVPAAVEAYYELVDRREVRMNQLNVAGESAGDGNTDMGSNVSVIGGQNAAGQPVRLILMKIKEEYWKEDQLALERRNVAVMQAIFGDEAQVGMGGVKAAIPDGNFVNSERTKLTSLFNRKIRKATIKKRV